MVETNGLEASNDVTQNIESTGVENNTPIVSESTMEQSLSDLASVVEDIKAVSSAPEVVASRNIPLSQPVEDAIVMSFEDACQLDFVEEDIVFEVIASKGRGGLSFSGKTDTKRGVRTFMAEGGKAFFLPLSVHSAGKSEGGTIGAYSIEKNTKFRFPMADHKEQATVILANGKSLVGYVAKGFTKEGKVSKRTFYFPRILAEKVIQMPEKGQIVQLKVKKILVG